MTSRVLAVARETVIAYLFGAGNAMDAYNVAFRVPNLLRTEQSFPSARLSS